MSQPTSPLLTTTVLNGEDISLAPLETINFSRLESKDTAETSRLLQCGQTHGFFYLDFQRTDSTSQFLADKMDILGFMETYFDQPLEVKMNDRASLTHGYKPVGTYAGVNENSKDCYEILKIARAEMVSKPPNLPVTVNQNGELFGRFISFAHYVTKTLLSCFSDALGLDASHRFENSHRDGRPANNTLGLLRYPKNADAISHVGHNKHTDIGSLTLLFTHQWGLQVLSPQKKEWAFIQPRINQAVINVGDSLRFLSGKRLYSALHRVFPVNGAYQAEHRYSLAYFLRPESDTKFEDADGQKVTAAQWHDEKYVMFAETHTRQEMSKMLTGGMEQILVN